MAFWISTEALLFMLFIDRPFNLLNDQESVPPTFLTFSGRYARKVEDDESENTYKTLTAASASWSVLLQNTYLTLNRQSQDSIFPN